MEVAVPAEVFDLAVLTPVLLLQVVLGNGGCEAGQSFRRGIGRHWRQPVALVHRAPRQELPPHDVAGFFEDRRVVEERR
jgi:hypothetical protein